MGFQMEKSMSSSFPYLLTCLLAGVLFIVLLTAIFRAPAFFALIAASLLVGLAAGIPFADILSGIKEGFGNIMKSLGLLIVMGTVLGAILEKNGSIAVIAEFILGRLGDRFIPLSMNIIGFFVGLPVFCDSGFIILSSLNNTVSRRALISPLVTSVSLASGLLAIHCLVPPHPGASAVATLLNVDFGRLLLWGLLVAIPASLAGYGWAINAGKKIPFEFPPGESPKPGAGWKPNLWVAILPIAIPVLLMASRSITQWEYCSANWFGNLVYYCGEPVIALAIGALIAIAGWRKKKKRELTTLLGEGAEKAGGILVIIGAGGSFGAIMTAMHFGDHLGKTLSIGGMGLLLPFLATSILKTAQGSSTVAIISSGALIKPLLPLLGLASENGHLLCLLAMGAGSMMVSHANDAYFWVISRFSGLQPGPMFRVYTLATLFMGLTGFAIVFVLSLFLPH